MVHRLRRRSNIKPALDQHLLFAGMLGRETTARLFYCNQLLTKTIETSIVPFVE